MRGVPNIQGKGIYMILNLVDCKVYVGQAKNFNKRNHFNQLISNRDNFLDYSQIIMTKKNQ